MSTSTSKTGDEASSRARPKQASRARLDAVGKGLGHPLILLLVTAAVSGVLVPQLTQQWQDQQQQVVTRRDFAARVSRTVGEIYIATYKAEVDPASETTEETQAQLDDAYFRWEIESAVLEAELRAYYPEDSLHDAWRRCTELYEAYYAQLGIWDAVRRREYLEGVHRRFALPAAIDLTDTNVLRAEVVRARDDVIRHVLIGRMI